MKMMHQHQQPMQSASGDSESTIRSSDADFKEIAASKFNDIRFPKYRFASKLRYLQKLANFQLIDLFNTLEAFREYGLNGNPDLGSLVANAQVYSLLDYLFVQLHQRLPIARSRDVDVRQSTDLVNQTGFTNLLALKTALTLLSAETYKRKLAYLFTLLSTTVDGTGAAYLLETSFDQFLRHILTIAQYFEDVSMLLFDEDLHPSLFNFSASSPPVTSSAFIEVLSSYENQADFTAWLVVYHRLADAELVIHHSATCAVCGRHAFSGFRYKCKKCPAYNLCQECFWTGKSSGAHDADEHACKEYLLEKPRLRQSLRQSFRNSFRRSPKKLSAEAAAAQQQQQQQSQPPPVDEQLTRKELNLTNIIASPTGQRKFGVTFGQPPSSAAAAAAGVEHYRFHDIVHLDHHHRHHQLPGSHSANSITNLSADEEHTLIGHYLRLLSSAAATASKSEGAQPTPRTRHFDSTLPAVNYSRIAGGNAGDLHSYEKAIDALESKNRLLMAQIAQMKVGGGGGGVERWQRCRRRQRFFDELLSLRRKKDDLEKYLGDLNDHRKVLMVQLDGLMREFQELDVNGNSGGAGGTSDGTASEPSFSRQSSVATTVERQFSTVSAMDTVDELESVK
ncbi:hypothetical protein TYRP_017970 [Tyrophagus putrescentiae]|nr:hypothetical protein TYRP_017970 [Tyrophagus putrescentiae]